MTPTILIVSPDEHTREELKKILAPAFPLIVAEDGAQCLAALKQKAPIALAFIGVSADEATGKLFEEVRTLAPKLTVIAVGESESEDDAIQAVRRGATGYVMPPHRPDDILTLARGVRPSA